MGRIVQEKFQVDYPQNRNDDSDNGRWQLDPTKARDHKGMQTRGRGGHFEPYAGDLYNSLPPGADISDQEIADTTTPRKAGSMGTGTQVTDDVTLESVRQGFDRKRMRATDDMYTREHNDAFYDEITVDGVTGFVERNNMLDRM